MHDLYSSNASLVFFSSLSSELTLLAVIEVARDVRRSVVEVLTAFAAVVVFEFELAEMDADVNEEAVTALVEVVFALVALALLLDEEGKAETEDEGGMKREELMLECWTLKLPLVDVWKRFVGFRAIVDMAELRDIEADEDEVVFGLARPLKIKYCLFNFDSFG